MEEEKEHIKGRTRNLLNKNTHRDKAVANWLALIDKQNI